MATGQKLDGELNLAEIATPATPAAGRNLIYPKADKQWYTRDSTGAERLLGAKSAAVRLFLVANFR